MNRIAAMVASEPDGQVDQEDDPPAQAEQVGVDQHPTEQRAGDRREPDDRAEGGERLAEFRRLEHLADDAEALRDQQRPDEALDRAGRDQEGRIGGQRTGHRGDGEAGGPDHEEILAAELVAQPATDDQRHGEGQGVGADHPLHRAGAAAEVALDGGGRQIDDRRVQQIHDLGGQDDRQHQPAPAVRR